MNPALFENNRQQEEMLRNSHSADIGGMLLCDVNEAKSGHIPFSDTFRRSGSCYYTHQTITIFYFNRAIKEHTANLRKLLIEKSC